MADCEATSPVSPDCCFAFFIIRSAQACQAFLIEVFYTGGWHHHSIRSQWSFPKGQQLSLVPTSSCLLPRDGGAHSSVWQSHTPLSFVPSPLPYLCKPWQPTQTQGTTYTKTPLEWWMTPVFIISMKIDAKHELFSANTQWNIYIWNPLWIIPAGLPQNELPCSPYTVDGDVALCFEGIR